MCFFSWPNSVHLREHGQYYNSIIFFSVCTPLLQRKMLHAPWTPVVTLDLNSLLSCKCTAFHQYVLSYVFFRWSKPVFICVNTGPLALTKIYFYAHPYDVLVYQFAESLQHISVVGQTELICVSPGPTQVHRSVIWLTNFNLVKQYVFSVMQSLQPESAK